MYTLRVAITVAVVFLLIVTLAFFLIRIAGLLNKIADVLGKVTFGVRAVETQTARVGPAAERLNSELDGAISGLERALESPRRSGGASP